jgi:hypothetical protein
VMSLPQGYDTMLGENVFLMYLISRYGPAFWAKIHSGPDYRELVLHGSST